MPIHHQVYGAVMISLLGERGELGGLAPYFDRLVRDMGALPGWRTPRAWAYVQSGRAEHARAEIEDLSRDGFAVFPRDTNFVPALAILAHAVGELGDAALAARVEPLLAPFGELWVVLGPGSSTLGPVAYALGVLQLVQDRLDDAVASFERALERAHRMRARPYLARARAGLADALRRRGAAGDELAADELHAGAVADAHALGMLRLQRELAAAATPRGSA